jgi:predicted PurR-regulated permease PerM
MYKKFLSNSVYLLLLLVLVMGILYIGKPVFMPLAIAALLALVFMPLCQWLEIKGINRVLSAIFCGLAFTLIISGVVALLTWHIKHIGTDFSGIQQNLSRVIAHFRQFLHESLGIEPPKQKDLMTATVSPDAAGVSHTVSLIMEILVNCLINLILIVVYLVIMLSMRPRFKEFILKLAPSDRQLMTKAIIFRSVLIVQQYLSGLALFIIFLWVMYSIGFSIVGIRNAVLFAILCGLLEVVPFVGNLTGSMLTSLMALSQGGGMSMVFGVLITYALIQFLQFYIITPLVMRTQVNINPLFTIVILIMGNLIWGITGMILAIPLLGIIKIVFDNIEPLQPLGILIGQGKAPKQSAWMRKVRTRLGRLIH